MKFPLGMGNATVHFGFAEVAAGPATDFYPLKKKLKKSHALLE